MNYVGMILAGFAAVILFATGTRAGDTETTLKGTILCAKCALKETDSCQNVIQVQEKGKTVIYVAFSHQVSKALVSSCRETQTLTKDMLLQFIQQQEKAA